MCIGKKEVGEINQNVYSNYVWVKDLGLFLKNYF